jgi:anti-sigma regulatory factor (Ser/Thr protein kinase)
VEEDALTPDESELIEVIDHASISLVRERVRSETNAQGLSVEIAETLALLATELATNQLAHARDGNILVHRIAREGTPGIEVIAADRGRGLEDPKRALAGGESTAGGLGQGIAACARLADELDVDVRIDEGTEIRVRKFAAPLSSKSEVGIMARPLAGEPESGDDAVFLRHEETVLVAVADGLGHGVEARAASRGAITAIRANASQSLPALIRDVGRALAGTRGAALAIARVDRRSAALEHAALGDVQAHLYAPRTCTRFPPAAGVLGARATPAKIATHTSAIGRGNALVLFTDGLKSRIDIKDELDLLWGHPIVIAQSLLARFARPHDDALVLVVR